MDDFTTGFREGWTAAIAEAERRCQQVWFPTGEPGRAACVTELVRIRQLPAQAKKAVE